MASLPPSRYIAPSTSRISTAASAPWPSARIVIRTATGLVLIAASPSIRPSSGVRPVIR